MEETSKMIKIDKITDDSLISFEFDLKNEKLR